MKVLLRRYGEKYYVWKDAVWKDGWYYVDRESINQSDIISIKEDDREKFVRCLNCGAFIKDDPESIEKHFADEEAKKDCFNCGCLRVNNTNNVDVVYKKNEDGTYHQTRNADVFLLCSQFWPHKNIDSQDIHKGCIYHRCRHAGVQKISDVFVEHPGLFDKQITVDVLKAKGFEYEGYRNGYFEYDLKLRGSLKACVNELGIVDHFLVKYRYYSANAYYSEKYDKLIYAYRGEYCDHNRVNVSESKHNSAKAKISALYKEASNE